MIEAKLEDELSLRNEATAASQALDDLKQECSQYDNQARGLETEIKQAETQLRYFIAPLSFIAQYVCSHSSICCTVPCYFLLLSLCANVCFLVVRIVQLYHLLFIILFSTHQSFT